MKRWIVAVALVTLSAGAMADDKKIVYLGDGRHTCVGDDCGGFNARERQRQMQREAEQRSYQPQREGAGYNEYREQRQRERDSSPSPYERRRY